MKTLCFSSSVRARIRFPFHLLLHRLFSSVIDAWMVSALLFDSCMSCFAHDLIKLMSHSDEN